MKRTAGKWLALLMSLMMVFSSAPFASLAETQYSDNVITLNAETVTDKVLFERAKKAAEAAEVENASTGAYLKIVRAAAAPQTVATGADFTYTVAYSINVAPNYTGDSNETVPAFKQYTDVKIVVTVPEGVVIPESAGYAEKNGNVYTFRPVENNIASAQSSQYGQFNFAAYIAGNGTVPNGKVFDGISVEISAIASVSVGEYDPQEYTFTYTLASDNASDNASAVTNSATNAWTVEKSLKSGYPKQLADGTVEILWSINAGKEKEDTDGAIVGDGTDYNVAGALNFESFTLTDVLKEIGGYAPTEAALYLGASATGTPLATYTAGDMTLSTSQYNETNLTAGHAESGAETPDFTTYTVRAVYPAAAFAQAYDDPNDEITPATIPFENTAQIDYTLVGTDAKSAQDDAGGSFGIPTPGGKIQVTQYIQIGSEKAADNSNVYLYNATYQKMFAAPATFGIYRDETATELAAELTLANGNYTVTSGELAPGQTYYVKQTDKPDGTNDNSTIEKVELASGQTAQVEFINVVPTQGILEIDKVDASTDKGMKGVAFTVSGTTDAGEAHSATFETDDNGHGVVALPAGTYTLTETTTPAGYAPLQSIESIEIEEGETNATYTGANAIRNYKEGATLTINKRIATDKNGDHTQQPSALTGLSEAFSFNVYQRTKGDFAPVEGSPFVIAAGQNATSIPLPVADEDGNPYYYKVQEVAGTNASIIYDTAIQTFTFWNGETNNYDASKALTFTNTLKSTLTFKKVVQGLDGQQTALEGAMFNIYTADPTQGGSAQPVVTAAKSNEKGVVTAGPLFIHNADGKPIQYYIVETNIGAEYTVRYPNDSTKVWGPITLDVAPTTDKTGTPVVNQLNQTSLTITKTDSTGKAKVAGAQFTISAKVDGERRYLVKAADGKYAFTSATPVTYTTKENGQLVLSGLPTGAYTIEETSVPAGYLPSGSASVLVNGTQQASDTVAADAKENLTLDFTLNALDTAAATFKNDTPPVIRVSKSLAGGATLPTAENTFQFSVYYATDSGVGAAVTVNGQALQASLSGAGTVDFTLPGAGSYYIKESAGSNAAVVYPHITKPSGAIVTEDVVFYGPYTFQNNTTAQGNVVSLVNTPNAGDLVISKTNAKTYAALAGATFTVSVPASGLCEYVTAALGELGFQQQNGNYVLTTQATGGNGQVTVAGLPVYNVVEGAYTLLNYTVAEASAPEGYIPDTTPQTAQFVLANNLYSASLTFANVPEATITVQKNAYRQWEVDTKNPSKFPLDGATLAVYKVGEADNLELVTGEDGQPYTVTTANGGVASFTGLDGMSKYVVIELSNSAGYAPAAVNGEDIVAQGEFPASAVEPNGMSESDALATYCAAVIDFTTGTELTKGAELINLESYTQLSLRKYYYALDDEDRTNQINLNRAKFLLYRCEAESADKVNAAVAVNALGANATVAQIQAELATYMGEGGPVSVYDYVYETGTAPSKGDGWLVTSPLPSAGYVYAFLEIEAPSGFKDPTLAHGWTGFSDSASFKVENIPVEGPGIIRYVQVELDKVARAYDGKGKMTREIDLADATFELVLLGANGEEGEELETVATFTTGVDVPGKGYLPGRAISQSFDMGTLYEEHPGAVELLNPVYEPDGEGGERLVDCEYRANFLLREIAWPGNTTPETPDGWEFTITTNGEYDTMTGDDTMYSYLTEKEGMRGPVVNRLTNQIVVVFEKYGYVHGNKAAAEPLAGAEITVATNERFTENVQTLTTGEDGRASFYLDENTTYYWKETGLPTGYEYENGTAPGGPFKTPYYKNSAGQGDGVDNGTAIDPSNSAGQGDGADNGTAIDPSEPIRIYNVQYRTLQLKKLDADGGNKVAATLQVQKGGSPVTLYQKNAEGAIVSIGTSVNTPGANDAADYVEVLLPAAGEYTIVETGLVSGNLSQAEKTYFDWINEDVATFSFGDNATHTIIVSNAGKGGFSFTKVDDTGKALDEGIQFNVEFKDFASKREANSANTTADSGWGSVPTGQPPSYTTDAQGEISASELVPGWYKLTEQPGTANKDHALADPVIFKVTADNLGRPLSATTDTFGPAEVVNHRKGYLEITKLFEGYPEGTQLDEAQFTITGVDADGQAIEDLPSIKALGNEEEDTLLLPEGTYTITETLDASQWFAHYAVSGSLTEAQNREKNWLDDEGQSIVVKVASENTAENPVQVTVTNVWNKASFAVNKTDDGEQPAPVEDATFNLYYTQGSDARVYWTGSAWASDGTPAAFASDATGVASIEVSLPRAYVTDEAENMTFYIVEAAAPEGYTLNPEPVAVTPDAEGDAVPTIVNETAIDITLTKYNRPRGDESGQPLAGATFDLYKLSTDENGNPKQEKIDTQTTDSNGQLTFANLPKLKGNDRYAIQETQADGYVLELVEIDEGETELTAGEGGLFTITEQDADVALTAYNTPYARIAVLKYDYADRQNPPTGGSFTATGTTIAGEPAKHTPGGVGTVPADAPALDGYSITNGYYTDGTTNYTVRLFENVIPGTYTVTEDVPPKNYLDWSGVLGTGPDGAWATERTNIPVPADGSTVVVVFANLPSPEYMPAAIDKAAQNDTVGSLQQEGGQDIAFTISQFANTMPLPMNQAQLVDERLAFTGAADPQTGAAREVDESTIHWNIESITIGAASYGATPYNGNQATEAAAAGITATVEGKGADGWRIIRQNLSLATQQTVNFGEGYQGFRVTYSGADGKLAAGFTAEPITVTINVRQDGGEGVVPVATVQNWATITHTYPFDTAQAQVTATATATDDAQVAVTETEEPPRVAIDKETRVVGKAEGDTSVRPLDVIEYTITATGMGPEAEDGIVDPILADIVPNGLVVQQASATLNGAQSESVAVNVAGQVVTARMAGMLQKDDALTLTIRCQVQTSAMEPENAPGGKIVNTAYLYTETTVPANADNPAGVSFRDEKGQLPQESLPAALGAAGLKALADTAENTVIAADNVSIRKTVSSDRTNWVSSESYVTVEPGSTFYYRITVTNNSESAITNLVIADDIPRLGDGRGTRWAPTLVSGTVTATAASKLLYSAVGQDASITVAGVLASGAVTIPEGYGDNAAGAQSILAVIDTVPVGESVQLEFTCTAPRADEATAQNAYYQMAYNDAWCTFTEAYGVTLQSADTKVTLLPESVSIGDKVWIDVNEDGIQNDEAVSALPSVRFTLRPYASGAEQQAKYTESGADGLYAFSGLAPAAPGANGADYKDGDVIESSLLGLARTTYRLSVNVPEGYIVTDRYAENGGSVPVVGQVNRENDNNFFSETGASELFYIPALTNGAPTNDTSYDLGLIRMRDLRIHKIGSNGAAIEGVEFTIYGPYYSEMELGTSKPFDTLAATDGNGDTEFVSNADQYLNAYAYYLIVEKDLESEYYVGLESVSSAASGSSVSKWEGQENAFVLAPYAGSDASGRVQDSVTVTNTYESSGELELSGSKQINGVPWTGTAGEYMFKLASEDDPAFGNVPVTARVDADGNFKFTLRYTFEQHVKDRQSTTYTYTLSEVSETAVGMTYDDTVYTISVSLADDGAGAITPTATIAGTEQTSNFNGETQTSSLGGLDFNNLSTGSLVVTKQVTSNASTAGAEQAETYNVTVKLTPPQGVTLTGKANGTPLADVPGATGADGVWSATFALAHNGKVEFTGLPAGTIYEVTEAEYPVGFQPPVIAYDPAPHAIVQGKEAQVTVTNEHAVASLRVKKVVIGSGSDSGDAFTFRVALENAGGVEVDDTYNVAYDPAMAANQPDTLTVRDGTAEITLYGGQTATIKDVPLGTKYTVTELASDGTDAVKDATDANGYVLTTDNGQTGTIASTEGAYQASFTNERNTGSLSVEKIVEGTGAEAEKEFAFTLQLTNAGVTLEGAYPADINGTDTTVAVDASGKATFKLKDGETITINGIPDGTTYEVLEQDYSANGYETTSTLDSGEIIDGETAQAKFTNHRDVGSLKITKEVAGNGEDAPNALTEFEVTVELTPPQGVTLVGTWEQGEESGNVAASNTFTLTDGESVELTGLPTGTSYTIAEADYAANGYITDIDTASGEITDGALRATVLNTMNVGDLSVLKTVNGSGAETDREFSFTLTLINEAGVTVDNTYETSEGTLTVTGGKATFTLKGGESLSIYGIPEGTDYTVTEADPVEYGYLITATSGEEGAIGTGMSSATFTNTRDIGELSIEKKVTGALGETDKAFAFTLELTPSGNGIGVDGTYDATLYTAGQETSTTVTVANGIANFNLTHDQRLVIHEIPAGATYAVSEESYALEGYQTSASSETGTIPATGSMPVATFTNTRNGGSLRIVKNFAGNAAIPGDTFAFTIRLGRLDGVNVDGTYDALRNGVAEPITFTGGVATVWLGSGDTFEILGILSGTDYAVSEDIPVDSGYIGQGENETGTIPIDTAAQVTFTNARYTGNLTVRKTVAGNAAETDRSFRFTIFLRNPDGSNVNGTYPMTGRSAFITFVNGYASIRLAAGETATIHGILSGAYYSVSEDDANTDGYVTTASGVAGIIPAIASAQASFLNTRDVGTEETTTSRTVYKVWNDSDNADGLRPTELVVYLLADGVSIDAATLSEANGWSARFDNLPVYNADGSAIEYQVVEAYTAEYYVRYQYAAAVINIINSHNPEDFVPDEPRDPNLLTLIEDYMVPLGGNVNMNEGDCFN